MFLRSGRWEREVIGVVLGVRFFRGFFPLSCVESYQRFVDLGIQQPVLDFHIVQARKLSTSLSVLNLSLIVQLMDLHWKCAEKETDWE